MPRLSAKLKEKLEVDPEDFPRIAVNALKTLSYRPDLFDKHDNKIIYIDPHTETYGTDSWKCLYQAILTWEELPDGVELTIKVSEKNYGDDYIDECTERVERIWKEINSIIKRSKKLKPKESPWKARFAKLDDLDSAGLINDNPSAEQLSQSFLLGLYDGHKLRLPERLTHRHVLVCGPTGSGKSASIFIPNLIERTGISAIVTEAVSGNRKPVLYGKTAGWRALAGHRIVYFNPDDSHSMRINPVDLIKTFDDAQHLANLIIRNTTSDTHAGDQVWQQSETHLLQALLLHVAGFRPDLNKPSVASDGANIAYIRQMMRKGPDAMRDELKGTRLPIARIEFEAYLNNSSPNFRYGVISGLMSRLNLWVNPKIAAVTQVTDFPLEALKTDLFTIYLSVPIERPDYTPLAALIFNFVLTLVLKNINDLRHPLTLFLDEFTNYGHLPAMTRYLTVVRNAGVGVALGIQDPVQLEDVYRERPARILFGQPRTKIFFPTSDDRTAFRISRMLGTTTQREPLSPAGQLSNRESPVPLMDPTDFMNLEIERKYVALTTAPPVKLDPLNYWQHYKDPTDREPPDTPEIPVDDDLEQVCSEARRPPDWEKIAQKEISDHNKAFNKAKGARRKPQEPEVDHDRGQSRRSQPRKEDKTREKEPEPQHRPPMEERDEDEPDKGRKKSYWDKLRDM